LLETTPPGQKIGYLWVVLHDFGYHVVEISRGFIRANGEITYLAYADQFWIVLAAPERRYSLPRES
jgi:hypothetical protein